MCIRDSAIPYALVGIFVLAVALVLSRIKLPDPRRAHEADTNEMVEEKPMRVMAFGFGMLALFLYVAAQTGVNSFFINYAEESIHIEKQTASLYLAFGGMGPVSYTHLKIFIAQYRKFNS